VVINDLDAEPAAEVESAVKAAGGEASVAAAAVCPILRLRKPSWIKAAGQWGRIDILVNNAGLTRDAMIHRMTDDQYNLRVWMSCYAERSTAFAAGLTSHEGSGTGREKAGHVAASQDRQILHRSPA